MGNPACDICGGRGFDYIGWPCRVCNPRTYTVPSFTVVDSARWEASGHTYSELVGMVAAIRKVLDHQGHSSHWMVEQIERILDGKEVAP